MTGITIQPLGIQIFGSALWILINLISLIIKKKSRPCKESFPKKQAVIFFFGLYLLFLASLTIFPISIRWEGIMQNITTPYINLIPFNYPPIGYYFIIRNIFGNLVLLAPLGFFLPLLNKKFYKLKYCFMLAFITSLLIESLQYLLAYFQMTFGRVTDITDLILNTIGITIGWLIFSYLFKDVELDREDHITT